MTVSPSAMSCGRTDGPESVPGVTALRKVGCQPVEDWTGALLVAETRPARAPALRARDPRAVAAGGAAAWRRAVVAARLDRGTIYDRQLPAMRPAVAALVDSVNRRWS